MCLGARFDVEVFGELVAGDEFGDAGEEVAFQANVHVLAEVFACFEAGDAEVEDVQPAVFAECVQFAAARQDTAE